MRRSRVACCLASSTQQMNSLRAKGVMSFQASSAVRLAISTSRRSAGSLCTTPPGSRWLVTRQPYTAGGARLRMPGPCRGGQYGSNASNQATSSTTALLSLGQTARAPFHVEGGGTWPPKPQMGDLIAVKGADPYSGEAHGLVPRWLG